MIYSIEVDKYDPTALTYCLQKLENGIPDYGYDWRIYINAGGIDYGVFLNINIERKEIEICNQSNGEECYIDDIVEMFKEDNFPEWNCI